MVETSDASLHDDADVLIVGGGPAGLAVALRVAGHLPARVVVLEKSHYPRDKLCGGAITPSGIVALTRLGLAITVPHVAVRRVRLRYRNSEITVDGTPALVVVCRREFDHSLARAATARGVVIREGAKVTDIERVAGGAVATSNLGRHRGRVVVLADGSASRLHQLVALRKGGVARALEVRTTSPQHSETCRATEANFDFTALEQRVQGYCWNFPMYSDGAVASNSGVYDARIAAAAPRADLPGVLQRFRHAHGIPPAPLEGFGIRRFHPLNALSADRVLRVGDAAGVDPLFGEGITYALRYGELAGIEIETAFARQDWSFRGYRWRILRSDIGRSLLRRSLLAELLYRGCPPRVIEAVWRRTARRLAPAQAR